MKNLLLTICLLAASVANGATWNTTTDPILDSTFVDTLTGTHIDTTTNLEWLDFGTLVGDPMTFGHSINSAQLAYGEDNGGWRLATYDEVYALWDRFFPTVDNTLVFTSESQNYTGTLVESRNSWMFAFGTDAVAGGDNTLLYSTGLFVNEQGDVDIMGLKFDVASLTTTLYGPGFTGPSLTLDSAGSNLGVFMVRETVVPLPAAVWLFGSGLLGLLVLARRKAN